LGAGLFWPTPFGPAAGVVSVIALAGFAVFHFRQP
jgi:hypothetical protein